MLEFTKKESLLFTELTLDYHNRNAEIADPNVYQMRVKCILF